MKDIKDKTVWVDVSKQAVKALNESYSGYKATVKALQDDYNKEAMKLNSKFRHEAMQKFEQSKKRVTADFLERNRQIRNTLQADLGKATKLQPLLRSEMDFLDSMRYLKPEPEELQQLAQSAVESGADGFVRALTNMAAEQGYTLLNVPPRGNEILNKFDGLVGMLERLTKAEPVDIPFVEVGYNQLAEKFQEFSSERDSSGNYKQIRAIKTPETLEEMIATDLQLEREQEAKNG